MEAFEPTIFVAIYPYISVITKDISGHSGGWDSLSSVFSYCFLGSEGYGDRLQTGLTITQSTLHQVSLDLKLVSVAVLQMQTHFVILHLDIL